MKNSCLTAIEVPRFCQYDKRVIAVGDSADESGVGAAHPFHYRK